jgi:two-component system sensor histidine kinase BarA
MPSVTPSESKSRKSPDAESDDNSVSIADLQKRAASLEEQNRKLKQASEYRSAFLARLAHELRTPLTSILGFSEILLTHEQLNEAQRGFCERIQKSAQQLQGSLSQLADLSRLEAGLSELHLEHFSLDELLRDACAGLARLAEKQNANLLCHTAINLPLISSDRTKLGQVISNFVAYAITRSPGAQVIASAEADPTGFLLKIEDEGEVPADSIAFVEMDPLNRRAGSSELGLAIARQNLDLLGADLSFHHRQPRGLEVLIHLPSAPPDAAG